MLCEHCATHTATIGTSCVWCAITKAKKYEPYFEQLFRRDQVQPTRELLKDET